MEEWLARLAELLAGPYEGLQVRATVVRAGDTPSQSSLHRGDIDRSQVAIAARQERRQQRLARRQAALNPNSPLTQAEVNGLVFTTPNNQLTEDVAQDAWVINGLILIRRVGNPSYSPEGM